MGRGGKLVIDNCIILNLIYAIYFLFFFMCHFPHSEWEILSIQ